MKFRNQIKILLFYLLLLFFCISHFNCTHEGSYKNSLTKILNDTSFNAENGFRENWFFQNLNGIKKQLGLSDSINQECIFRIWINYSGMKLYPKVFILSVNNHKTRFEKILYEYGLSDSVTHFKTIKWHKKISMIPKDGDVAILNKIFNTQFFNLFNKKEIESDGGIDGSSVVFEFIDEKKSWLAEYTKMNNHLVKSKPYVNARDLIEYIENKFEF